MLSVVSLKYRDARQQQDQSWALQSPPCRNGTIGTTAPLLFVPFPLAETVSGPADLRLTTVDINALPFLLVLQGLICKNI